MDDRAPSTRKKILFTVIIGIGLLLVAEAGAHVVLRVAYGARGPEEERLNDYDAELGWVNMKNRRVADRYGPNKHATHNAMGLRAIREYTPVSLPGRYRVVFIGDSFTYGVDVGDTSTFAARVESLAPSIETVNMGVAGYGVDQMYLSYAREQERLGTNLVVLAFIGDDLRRMKLSAFLQNPKPQLFLRGDTLTVANVPVPTWGLTTKTSWLTQFPSGTALARILRSVYDMFVQDYDPVPVAEQVFADLNQLVLKKGQRLALVYLPSQPDMASDRPTAAVGRLEASATRDRIPFFNLTDAFKVSLKAQNVPLFVKDGRHYTEAGHRVIAELLLNRLRQTFPDVPRDSGSQESH